MAVAIKKTANKIMIVVRAGEVIESNYNFLIKQ
jgi:hypothetical protein